MEEIAHIQLFTNAVKFKCIGYIDCIRPEHLNGAKKYIEEIQVHSFHMGGNKLFSQNQD